jgi:Calcineurin-like phosphoesterase
MTTWSSRRRIAGLLAAAAVLLAAILAVPWAAARREPGTPVAPVVGRAAPVPPRGEDPVVVAAGDIAPEEETGHHRSTSDQVLEIDPDAVLVLGDLQYPAGELEHFKRYYDPTWGRFKDITRPAPGNHEYDTRGAAGYFDYFGAQARPDGASYYSFDLGGWHLVSLDSNIDRGAGSAQERWLRADLAATDRRCVLAYWHHPRFSSGTEHGSHRSVVPFWRALYDAKADVVLGGHEHNYERFAPQDPDGQADPLGPREFVVGTGGKSLYGFGAPERNSEVREHRAYGVLKLILRPLSYDWEFVSPSGAIVDSGGPIPCH